MESYRLNNQKNIYPYQTFQGYTDEALCGLGVKQPTWIQTPYQPIARMQNKISEISNDQAYPAQSIAYPGRMQGPSCVKDGVTQRYNINYTGVVNQCSTPSGLLPTCGGMVDDYAAYQRSKKY